MRTLTLTLCGLLLLLLVGLPAFAARGSKTTNDPIKSEYDTMAKVVTLTADQKPKFDAKVADLELALKNWDTTNADSEAKLKTDIKTAQTANDKNQVKLLQTQQKQLMDQRKEIELKGYKDIMDLLTPDQKQAWAIYKLQEEVSKHFTKAKLTDDQIAKIKPLCEAAVKEREQLPSSEDKQRRAVVTKLFDKIKTDVLTDDQRAQLAETGKSGRGDKGSKADTTTTPPPATTTPVTTPAK